MAESSFFKSLSQMLERVLNMALVVVKFEAWMQSELGWEISQSYMTRMPPYYFKEQVCEIVKKLKLTKMESLHLSSLIQHSLCLTSLKIKCLTVCPKTVKKLPYVLSANHIRLPYSTDFCSYRLDKALFFLINLTLQFSSTKCYKLNFSQDSMVALTYFFGFRIRRHSFLERISFFKQTQLAFFF